MEAETSNDIYLLVFSRLAGVGCQFAHFYFAKCFENTEIEEYT